MWSIVFVVERIIHHIQLLPNKTNIQWPSTVKYLKIPKMNKTNTRVRDQRENSRHYYRNHGDSKKNDAIATAKKGTQRYSIVQ